MTDVTLTGMEGLLAGLAVVALTLLIIFIFRLIINRRSKLNFKEKYKDNLKSFALKNRTKYPEVDGLAYTRSFFHYGLAAALALTLFAFSWTTYDTDIFIPTIDLTLDDEIEVTPPRIPPPPPTPPPPPPPVIEEVEEDEILEEDEPEFIDQDLDEETVLEESEPVEEEAVPPPSPPPPIKEEPDIDEIFMAAEQMPRFPGCENAPGDNKAKAACAEQKMLQYIYKNLKYPAIAIENSVEGMCVIQFVVAKDGSITDAKIVRNIGGGCGNAALSVVEAMNNLPQKWTPGKQRNKIVKVLYTLPVRFRLEG